MFMEIAEWVNEKKKKDTHGNRPVSLGKKGNYLASPFGLWKIKLSMGLAESVKEDLFTRRICP
jgi:hypothetical protein